MKFHVKITMHFTEDDVKAAYDYQIEEGFEPFYPANAKNVWWKTYDVESAEKALHDCMIDFAQSHMECYTYGKPVTFEIANDEYDEIMKKKQEEESAFSDFFDSLLK